MMSDLECGVCYRVFNSGRRCPLLLRCSHTFCESCLLELRRPPPAGADERAPPAGDGSILCPLCRHPTPAPEHGRLRAELAVDEAVVERLLDAGLLGGEEEGEEEGEEAEEALLPDSPADHSGSSAASRGGRLRRSWKKVWRRISAKNSGQTSDQDFMSSDDMKHFAMMSCLMF